MNIKKISARLYIITFLVVVGLGVSYYLILGQKTDNTVTNQLLKRQLTLARAQSGNIISFFNVFGDSIAIFSRLSSVHARNEFLQSDLDNFVDQRKDGELVGGISVVSEQGIIDYNSNISGVPDVGDSISDRDYFNWAKDQTVEGVFFIGSPIISRIGATKGEPIIPVASPIIDDGVFKGVVIAPVRLNVLTDRYMEFLKVSDEAEIFLISEDGIMIYSNFDQNLIDQNVFEVIAENPFLGSNLISDRIKTILDEKKEGSMKTSFLSSADGLIKDYYLAYSPITLKNQNWMLVVATPSKALSDIKTPLMFRLKLMLLLVSITFIVYGLSVKKETESNIKNIPTNKDNQNKL